jgi:hypothetical protein
VLRQSLSRYGRRWCAFRSPGVSPSVIAPAHAAPVRARAALASSRARHRAGWHPPANRLSGTHHLMILSALARLRRSGLSSPVS